MGLFSCEQSFRLKTKPCLAWRHKHDFVFSLADRREACLFLFVWNAGNTMGKNRWNTDNKRPAT